MRNAPLNVFVVEKDQRMNELLKNRIELAGNKVSEFGDINDCIRAIHKRPDLVFIGEEGTINSRETEAISAIKSVSPETNVVVMSNNESLELAVGALKKGASDFLLKDASILTRVELVLNEAASKKDPKPSFKNRLSRMAFPMLSLAGLVAWVFTMK